MQQSFLGNYALSDDALGDDAFVGDALSDDALGDDAFVGDALGGFGDGPGNCFVFSGTSTSFAFSGTSTSFAAPAPPSPSLRSSYLGDDALDPDHHDGGLQSCADYDQGCDFDAARLNTEENSTIDTLFEEDHFAMQVQLMESSSVDNTNLLLKANGQIFETLQKTICGSTEKDLAMKAGEFPDCPDGRKVIEYLQVNDFEAAAEVVAHGDQSFKKVCIKGYVLACKHTSSRDQRKPRKAKLCAHSMCSKQTQSSCLGFCAKHAPSHSDYKLKKGPAKARKLALCSESSCSKQAQSSCLGFCAKHAPSHSDYKQKKGGSAATVRTRCSNSSCSKGAVTGCLGCCIEHAPRDCAYRTKMKLNKQGKRPLAESDEGASGPASARSRR
jgi:hypothetical protein